MRSEAPDATPGSQAEVLGTTHGAASSPASAPSTERLTTAPTAVGASVPSARSSTGRRPVQRRPAALPVDAHAGRASWPSTPRVTRPVGGSVPASVAPEATTVTLPARRSPSRWAAARGSARCWAACRGDAGRAPLLGAPGLGRGGRRAGLRPGDAGVGLPGAAVDGPADGGSGSGGVTDGSPNGPGTAAEGVGVPGSPGSRGTARSTRRARPRATASRWPRRRRRSRCPPGRRRPPARGDGDDLPRVGLLRAEQGPGGHRPGRARPGRRRS